MANVKIFFIGDIVGASGRDIVKRYVPQIRRDQSIDLVVANGENAAHGFGLTPKVAEELFEANVDILTGGNHTWDKKDIFDAMDTHPDRILRPANYPEGTAGQGTSVVTTASGHPIGVINLMARVFMDPLACPFRTFDQVIGSVKQKTNMILLDLHGEATSEKVAMGWHVDGRISALVGTHTHVQTADEKILPQGTGYLTDAGMTGPIDSVIGMKKEIILKRFLLKQPHRMEVATGPSELRGVIFTLDSETGKCLEIERVFKV